MPLNNYVELMRPRQWFKSLYVVFGAIPAVFLTSLEPLSILRQLSLGVLNMILIQGSIYAINDVADVNQDSRHPRKKHRPVASGAISPTAAVAFATFLFALALALGLSLDPRIAAADVALVVLALLYSFAPRLKNRLYLDILTPAANFPLRVAIGWWVLEPLNQAQLHFSYAINSIDLASQSIQALLFNSAPRVFDVSLQFSSVTLSFVSMMGFTYFLATYLMSLKRLAEKLSGRSGRVGLVKYSIPVLKVAALASALAAVVFALLLAFSLKLALVFAVPLLVYIMRWYYRLAFAKDSPVQYPENVITGEPRFVAMSIAFVVLSVILLFV